MQPGRGPGEQQPSLRKSSKCCSARERLMKRSPEQAWLPELSRGSHEGELGGDQEGAGPRCGNVSDGSLGGRRPLFPPLLTALGGRGPTARATGGRRQLPSTHWGAAASLSTHLGQPEPRRGHLQVSWLSGHMSPCPPSPALLYPCSPPTHCTVPGGRQSEVHPTAPGR